MSKKDGKQTKAVSDKVATQSISKSDASALAGRVKKLNELARQHAANGGKPVGRPAASNGGPRGGNSNDGGLRPSQSTASVSKLPPVVTLAVPRKKQQGGSAPAMKAKKYRIYHDSQGKEVARSEVVSDPNRFDKRLSSVKKGDFASKAVGLNSSQVYRGSKTMEHDFVKNGVRGVRLAGSQYLDTVDSGSHNNTVGSRLTVCLVNPTALGVQLAKMAELFEQSKVHHMKVIYKPVVSAQTDGAIAMYFRNDVSNPMLETGLDELQHAASHESFEDSTVWTPMSIDISPSDVMLRYWDEMLGDYANDIQGIITVLASSTLAADTTYGHLYIEFDVEFFAPEVDYEVTEIGIHELYLEWNDFSCPGPGVPLELPYRPAAPAVGQCGWRWGETGPPNSEFMPYGVLYQLAVEPNFSFCTHADLNAQYFAGGQNLFFRLSGIPTSGTWNGVNVKLFADLTSASDDLTSGIGSDDFDATPGQLVYESPAAAGSISGKPLFRVRMLPLASAQ
jgi:hypothetical protein